MLVYLGVCMEEFRSPNYVYVFCCLCIYMYVMCILKYTWSDQELFYVLCPQVNVRCTWSAWWGLEFSNSVSIPQLCPTWDNWRISRSLRKLIDYWVKWEHHSFEFWLSLWILCGVLHTLHWKFETKCFNSIVFYFLIAWYSARRTDYSEGINLPQELLIRR